MLRSRLFAEWCLTLLVTLVLTAVAVSYGLTQRLDLALQDRAMEFAAGEPETPITIVKIDDRSLQEVGPWPWSREVQARLIDELAKSGAGAIVFDVLLLEPSAYDDVLAKSMDDAGNVLIPFTFGPKINSEDGRVPVLPVPDLRRVAAGSGHVELDFDEDGAVRRLAAGKNIEGSFKPHLMLETYRFAYGEEPAIMTNGSDPARARIFPYHGPQKFSEVSAADFLRGSVANQNIDGGIVMVGATAQGLSDSFAVPNYAGSVLSGIEIQANFLDAMVQDSFVSPVGLNTTAFLTTLVVLVLFIAFWALEPARLWRIATLMILLIVALALALPALFGLWFAPSAILVAFVIAYPFWGWRRLSSVVNYIKREASNLEQFDNSKEGVQGAGFDEAARHVSQLSGLVAKVRERFEFIRGVVAGAPEPIVVLDDQGLSRVMNDAATEIFQVRHTGVSLADLLKIREASLNEARREIEFPDGRFFRFSRSRIDDGAGHSIGEIVQLYEFTQIRAAERERRETMEFLSHDMRSPQVAIIGLASGDGPRLNAKERFERIVQQAQRTLKLADDFVQIARLSARSAKQSEVDLGAQVIEAADRAYYEAQRKEIELVQEVEEDPIFVMGDPAMLARMLDNLLSNAIKFTPEGGEVVLTAKKAEGGEPVAVLSVADNGPGLPPERARSPFARFGSSSDSNGLSAGLGLAFVAEVVRQHGGEIDVTTKEGEGTSFLIKLPLA